MNTPFVFFFAVNTLKDTSGFFNMVLLIYGVWLPPLCQKPHIYPEKDLRAYPGAIRGTEEWNNTYKIRTTVERDINHIKDNLCLAGRRTQNEKTLHADLILAGITQLITVVLSDKINHHEFIRSLKPLIA